MNVVTLPNAPLDLYILMDLSDSMATPLATVKSISQLIGEVIPCMSLKPIFVYVCEMISMGYFGGSFTEPLNG